MYSFDLCNNSVYIAAHTWLVSFTLQIQNETMTTHRKWYCQKNIVLNK